MSTTPPPPTEAADWAARTAEEHGLPAGAAALLTDLYVPDLPGLVEEFDREVAALRDPPELLSWGVPSRRPATGLDELLEGLDDDRVRRVLVWSFTAWPVDTPKRHVEGSPGHEAAWRHWYVHRHFGNRTPVWDAAALSLLIRTADLGDVPARPLQRALGTVDRSELSAVAGELRAAADRLAARLGAHTAEEREREDIHQWLLRELLDLGHVPDSGEELCYGGDRYFGLLRRTHPDLLKAPGVPALLVHHLQEFRGPKWQAPLQGYLDATGDPAEVVRLFLETALSLPGLAGPAPRLTDEERRRNGYRWNAGSRDAEHLTRLASHVLEGMAAAVPFLPRSDAPWAVDLLERLSLRMETEPSRASRTTYLAHGLSSVLSRLGSEEAFRAVVRLRDRPGLSRTARKYHQSSVEQTARHLGWTHEETVERSVPDHGLAPDGTLTANLGAFTVVLALTGKGTEYTFTGPDGKAARRAPKELRESHPDELKDLQRRAAALRKALEAERGRLAGLAGSGRVWELPDWLPYYLRHPVTGPAAREVCWEASTDGVRWRSCTVEADGDHWLLIDDGGGTVLHTGRAAPGARIRA